MLRFSVFRNGGVATDVDLSSAYVIGGDDVPLRAEIKFADGHIICEKRTPGPAGLALLWPVEGFGKVLLETSRLVEREAPYNLHIELVRGRLMRINQKREDWGLYDYIGVERVGVLLDEARDLFVAALTADGPVEAARQADKALAVALVGGEKLSLFHAQVFLDRRRQNQAFGKRMFGCTVDIDNTVDPYRRRLKEGFDFVHLPIRWHDVEPKEQEFNWQVLDSWIEWCARQRVPIEAGPLVSFHEENAPDWLHRYERDYETVRSLVQAHVQRVVDRYGSRISRWNVISGIHAYNGFNLSFEQIIDLTRVACTAVKRLAPRALTIVDLAAPWGEYYARNQRTIPPLLYADMVVQSSVPFDALGIQMFFGPATDGMCVRDMFEISSMIDRIGNLGKPAHVTGVQVPSASRAPGNVGADGGEWHRAWNEELQAIWLQQFFHVAISKPFIESVVWRDLADRQAGTVFPHGGLLRANLEPKHSYQVFSTIRQEIAGRRRPAGSAAASNAK